MASVPDAAGAVGAYLELERWVRAFDPPAPELAAARLPIDGATAVCVILRQRGRVVGTGLDDRADDLMVRRAAGRAMAEALADRVVAALPESLQSRVGAALTVELEVAGALVPVPGRTFAQIAEQIEPGLDGVAMRRDDAVRWLLPSRTRSTNTAGSTARLLPSLAVDLGLPARAPDELSRQFGARFYRFRTTHLAQRSGRAPFATVRGQVLVPRSAVTREGIAAFAEGLTDHLLTSLWPGAEPFGLMGDYQPVRDRYVPLVAPPREQALVALALGRFAAVRGGDDAGVRRLRTAATVVLQELGAVAPGEDDPLEDPVACAAIVYAVSVVPGARDDPLIRAMFEAAATVVRAYRPEAGFVTVGEDGATTPLAPHGQAVLAGAWVRLLAVAPDLVETGAARSLLDATWETVPRAQTISLLPWIGWAEIDYASATGAELGDRDRLRALVAGLGSSRIADTGERPPDLAGGFALIGTRGTVASSQTARPAAFLATALRVPALTPREVRGRETQGHARTMRFLLQLAVDDSMLWSIRRERALGGLRAATWDSRQPVAAQAMALLAAAETLASLDATPPEEAPSP